MSISIVFDDERMPCTGISYNPAIENTPENRKITNWLLDPEEPRIALQRMRYLKTRETGNNQVTPDIIGRSTGKNIQMTETNPSYEIYKMRRKAGVLKSYNQQKESSRSSFAYFARSGKSKYKSMTNARIKSLIESRKCLTQPILTKPASNSGVFGDNTPLNLDPQYTFHSSL
tara:strand:+ start:335 stop:853 length:519 start_codon:yes stop_codon:yes gene_type:complete